MLVADGAAVDRGDHPDIWVQGDLRLPLTYSFEPGAPARRRRHGARAGRTCSTRCSPAGFDWQVPGLRAGARHRAASSRCPSRLRVRLVPAPDTARALLAQLEPRQGDLLDRAVARGRGASAASTSRPRTSTWSQVPDHLRMTFRVVAGDRTLAEGKDLPRSGRPRPAAAGGAVAAAAGARADRAAQLGRRRPAAGRASPVPCAASRRSSTRATRSRCGCSAPPPSSDAAHRGGVRRLLLLSVPSPVKGVLGRLTNAQKLALSPQPARHGAGAARRLRAGGGGRAADHRAPRRGRASGRCSRPPGPRCRTPCTAWSPPSSRCWRCGTR